MDAIHRRLVQPLQFLRRGDVCQDHEFLDQPMAVETRARFDRGDPPVAIEHDPAFGQVKVQRAACRPCRQQGAEGGVEMRQRKAKVIARVVRRLYAFVGQSPRAAHQPAAEAVGQPAPGRVDAEVDEQAVAVFHRAQAAPAIRQRLRQHRHDAVREIHAVAARSRRMVERRIGAHIIGDVGDRDDQAEA